MALFSKTGTERIQKVKSIYTNMITELDKGAQENLAAMNGIESDIALLMESIDVKRRELEALQVVNKEASELRDSIANIFGMNA